VIPFLLINVLDFKQRYDAKQLINHPFIVRGKELDSKRIIKDLVKSKINDLEDNRTKNFKKEIQNMENENIPSELIIKNKPKSKNQFEEIDC
jgi:hypothetical protein